MNEPEKIMENHESYAGRIFVFESLASTNTWALENVHRLQHKDVVRAVRQTQGRGRFGRKWISPGNLNLAFSVVIKCNGADERYISSVTQLAAIAVAESLRKIPLPAMVKWPNDVLVNGKKIAGILAERDTETGVIVLGVGININMTPEDFNKQELMQPATSIRMETGKDHVVEKILNAVLTDFSKRLDSAGSAFPVKDWEKIDFLRGKKVTVHSEDQQVNGSYSGMDESGRIRIIDHTGQERVFWSGDVSVRADS